MTEEGVEVNSAESGLLLGDRRGATGLVVGDHEPAVGVSLQPVDDATHGDSADLRLQHQLQADRLDPSRILDREISVEHDLGVLGEALGGIVVQSQLLPLLVGVHFRQ